MRLCIIRIRNWVEFTITKVEIFQDLVIQFVWVICHCLHVSNCVKYGKVCNNILSAFVVVVYNFLVRFVPFDCYSVLELYEA